MVVRSQSMNMKMKPEGMAVCYSKRHHTRREFQMLSSIRHNDLDMEEHSEQEGYTKCNNGVGDSCPMVRCV